MFEETLLDSSPTHAPVLRSAHWLICIAAGIAGYFLGRLALPFLTFAQGEALSTQAVFLAILLFFYALMLCYVYADAKHLGFSVGLWVAVTAVLYVLGFSLLVLVFNYYWVPDPSRGVAIVGWCGVALAVLVSFAKHGWLEFLGIVEIDQARMDRAEEDHHPGPGRAQTRSRSARSGWGSRSP